MPFSRKTYEEKPYNRCIDCVHIGKNCDGPNFLAMTTERWAEWCRLRKDYLGLTNTYIAEETGLSRTSVDRIMAGKVNDLRNTTMQAITKVLINGSWGQYPCAAAEISDEEAYANNQVLAERCKDLENSINNVRAESQQKIEHLQHEILFLEEQVKSKDARLKERYDFLNRKDRTIRMLAVGLVICLVAIIGALVVDAMNHNVGFFWLKEAISGIVQQIKPENNALSL